jgi:hypothetical protein
MVIWPTSQNAYWPLYSEKVIFPPLILIHTCSEASVKISWFWIFIHSGSFYSWAQQDTIVITVFVWFLHFSPDFNDWLLGCMIFMRIYEHHRLWNFYRQQLEKETTFSSMLCFLGYTNDKSVAPFSDPPPPPPKHPTRLGHKVTNADGSDSQSQMLFSFSHCLLAQTFWNSNPQIHKMHLNV